MNYLFIIYVFQLLRLILLGLRPLELVHYKVTFVNVGSLFDLLGVVGSIGGSISQYNEVMPLGIGRELEVGPEILRMDQQNPAQSANPLDNTVVASKCANVVAGAGSVKSSAGT